MPKVRYADYRQELQDQTAAWNRKPGLRAVYEHWYQQIVEQLAPLRPVVEIGAGCGNFKAFFPEVMATDVFPTGDWIDQLVDARELPFAADSVGNYVLIDCLHHIPRPVEFLRDAAATLQPGGRIVLLEPAVTWGSRLFWTLFHHEPIRTRVDFFTPQPDTPDDPGFTYANMGTAYVLFEKERQKLQQAIPQLQLIRLTYSDCFAYPATGGFSYYSLLPSGGIQACHRWEQRWCPKLLNRLCGLRMLIVLEKQNLGA